MPQQMGTLYTEELLTNSGPNECQSTEARLPQQWNAAIVCSKAKRNRELCLNPICALPSHFHIRRGLKDRWSQYRFPHSIFRQALSASPRSAPAFLLFPQSFFSHHSSSTCTPPVSFLFPHFISLSLSRCLYLSDSACTTTLRQAPYIRIGGEKRHFQIPSASISQDS